MAVSVSRERIVRMALYRTLGSGTASQEHWHPLEEASRGNHTLYLIVPADSEGS